MRIALALLARHGSLNPDSLQRKVASAELGVTFAAAPFRRDLWRTPTNDVALIVWDNDLERNDESRIVESDNVARTLAGYVVDPRVADCWNVAEVVRHVPFTPASAAQLGGAFVLFEATARPATLLAMNTIARLEQLYWSENDQEIAVSNRALVAHLGLTASNRPEIDLISAGFLAAEGFVRTDATPFRNVYAVPGNSVLIADVGGVVTAPLDDFEQQIARLPADKTAVDRITQELLATFGSRGDRRVRLSLSGGKDSRLVGAALRAVGIEATAATSGFDDSPDLIVGQMAAKALGFPHSIDEPVFDVEDGFVRVDPIERIAHNLRRADGTIYGWENIPQVQPLEPTIVVGGHGAAPYKGVGVAAFAGNLNPGLETVRNRMKGRFAAGGLFLRHDVEASMNNWVDQWISKQRLPSRLAIAERFYVETANPRWAGPLIGSYSNVFNWSPLYDNRLVRAGLEINPAEKVEEQLYWALHSKLAPDLLNMPFDRQRWKFEASGPLPGDESGWESRAPYRQPSQDDQAYEWRHQWTSGMYDRFHDQIFGSRDAASLFEVVDRVALLAWFEGRRGFTPRPIDTFTAWSMASASVLVENRWLEPAPCGEPVVLPVPAIR